MKDVVIVSGSRTAVGAFGGALKGVTAVELGQTVMKETLKKAGLRPQPSKEMEDVCPDKLKGQGRIDLENKGYDYDESLTPLVIDEVIMGCVLTSAQGQNPARQAMIAAGLSKETPAFTINKVCGSGLKAISLAAQSIMTGDADVVLAGGMESMSNAPLALKKARWGHRMEVTGTGDIHDLMVFDGLYEIFYGYHMGITAENIAEKYGISKEAQDKLSVLSHERARKAIAEGYFKDEIVPVSIKTRKGEVIVDTDERPMDTDMEKMGKMRPVFKKDGTVTAGNASGINDGAASVLLMSREKAEELGLEPLAVIKGFASGGLDPAYMGLGPVPAIRKLMDKTGMDLNSIDLIELNEAFASQALGCMMELGLDSEKPNQFGSGISLGHPIGCTGARQMVTLIHQMKRLNLKSGLVSMCIGGGMGMAMVVEK